MEIGYYQKNNLITLDKMGNGKYTTKERIIARRIGDLVTKETFYNKKILKIIGEREYLKSKLEGKYNVIKHVGKYKWITKKERKQ